MNAQSSKILERILKAFANKRRIEIVRFIRAKREANVSEIADSVKLSIKATSKHLGILSAVDVLEREQRNVQVFYRIAGGIPETGKKILSVF